MAIISLKDVLSFHNLDRKIYTRILNFGRQPSVARHIVVLWMWLEFMSIDVIKCIRDCNDSSVLLRFIVEAESILDSLRQDVMPSVISGTTIPLTASLVSEPLNLRFFHCHSSVVARGLAYLLDGVGRLIFDDGLNALYSGYETAVRAAEEEERRNGGLYAVSWPVVPQELAMPYECRVVPSSEDLRSLFITFDLRGHSVLREDILEYFTEKWGGCVENVLIEQTTGAVVPMYGRVVFTSESFVDLMLSGDHLVQFVIKGVNLWGRKYVPRNN